MRFLLVFCGIGLLVVAASCAYPRRGTSVSPVTDGSDVQGRPADVWQLEFVSAVLPPQARGALDWDEDGGPDAFIRLFIDGRQVWQGESVPDTLTPTFNQRPPKNAFVPANDEFRIELWEDDGRVDPDLIGVWSNQGLPRSAQPGGDTRIMLDGRASLVFRVHPPIPHRGVGIEVYEVRPAALHVIEVLPFSPASRAGLRAGDRIVEIDNQPVSQYEGTRAVSALSMSNQERSTLVVERGSGRETLHLDGGYLWLVL